MEKLKAQVAELEEKLATAETQAAELKEKLSTAETQAAELKEKLAYTETQVAGKGTELEDCISQNDQLQARISELESMPGKREPGTFGEFTLEKVTYVIKRAKVRVENKVVSSDEILESTRLQKVLVEIGASSVEIKGGGTTK